MPMNMHRCTRKIWQTAAVVKVHVGENDVTHVFRLKSKPPNLMDSRLL